MPCYIDHPGEVAGVLLFILVTLANVILIAGLRFAVERYKEREEKERLLMREVNHRAKNMLSVVDAIAHQTAAQNPEDFAERFSERIQALSASQDLLVRNEWKGVEIKDLVRAQLAHFADLIGSRIGRGRDEDYSSPPAQIPACAANAPGSSLRSNVGGTWFCNCMRSGAQPPIGSTWHLGSVSEPRPPVGCSPRVRPFPPRPPPEVAFLCSALPRYYDLIRLLTRVHARRVAIAFPSRPGTSAGHG